MIGMTHVIIYTTDHLINKGGNMKIGDKVFYLDAKRKEVLPGIVEGTRISDKGYELYFIVGSDRMIESKHVWKTKEDADKHAMEVLPHILKADEITLQAKNQIDELRIKVIGEPKHAELAKRIMEGSNAKK